MSLLEHRARLDVQLGGETIPDRPVRRQRVGVSSGRRHGGDKLGVQGFIERSRGRRLPQQLHHALGAASRRARRAASTATAMYSPVKDAKRVSAATVSAIPLPGRPCQSLRAST